METSLANRSHPQYLTVVTPHYCSKWMLLPMGIFLWI
jgi:hypothetical protein